MEKWDVYNIDRKKIEKQIIRGGSVRLQRNEYHITVHVALFNTRGQLLIQQRAREKATFASKWDITCGGAAQAGENSQAAATRELFEELGIDMDFADIRPQFTINYKNGFGDYYAFIKDVEPSSLRLQKEEVMDAKFASKAEIMELIESGKFIPYRKGFIELIFDMKDEYGAFKVD